MSSASRPQVLTIRQQNFCEYGGAFGVMLTLTCLIQHFVVIGSHWIANLMVFIYFFSIVAFLFFAFKKYISTALLIASAALSLGIEIIWVQSYSFSLVVLCLFFYHIVTIAVMFAEGTPEALKKKRDAEREEEMNWAGKI